MKIRELFTIEEARREPARNIRYTPADIINRYGNRDDVFVHFSNVPKLGMNPKSRFNTPMGLYSYPASYVANAISKGERTLHKRVPFMSDAQYVTIFRETGDTYNLCDYGHAKDLMIRFENLVRELLEDKGTMSDEAISQEIERMKRFGKQQARVSDIEGGQLWGQMFYIVDEFFNSSISSWARMFQRMGVDCIVDVCGAGIIHPSEPVQAIHFKPQQTIEVIEMMENRGKSNVDRDSIVFDPDVLDGEGRVKTLKMGQSLLDEINETFNGVGINGFIKSIGLQDSRDILEGILKEHPQYLQKHAQTFEMSEEDFLSFVPRFVVEAIAFNMIEFSGLSEEARRQLSLLEDIYSNVLKSAIQQLYTQVVVDILNDEKPEMVSLRLDTSDFNHFVVTLDEESVDMNLVGVQTFADVAEQSGTDFYEIDGGVDFHIPQNIVIDLLMEKLDEVVINPIEITDVKVNWMEYSGVGSNLRMIIDNISSSSRGDFVDSIVNQAASTINLSNL